MSARIEAVPYRPAGGPSAPQRGGPKPLVLALAGLLLFSLVAGLFFFLARSVRIDIAPAGANVDVDGGIGLALGSGHLLLPGDYRLLARAEGYEDLQAEFTVTDAAEQVLGFEMKRLPGLLRVLSEPQAEVVVDGTPRGTTPMAPLSLAAGAHRVQLRAPRYQAHEAEVNIQGGGVEQELRVTLTPGWAPVSVRSLPAGAEILVDGQAAGRTPATLELGAGAHDLVLRLDGYAAWRESISVKANEPLELAEARLLPAEGTVRLSSSPSGAAVRIGSDFRGRTPLDLRLAPGRVHQLQVSADGYRPAQRSIEVAAEATESISLTLEPILGTLALDVQPADAAVTVDGKPVAAGTTKLELVAVAHRVEATKAGYGKWSSSVTPRPGFEQKLEIRLVSEADARAARTPPRVTSKEGPALVLVPPGAYVMGTPRGEQGRQSNEAQRPVRLTRAFYLSATEVSNAQFRKFASAHSSGIVRKETLDNDRQPVARVRWDEAARYCNWLSKQEGLPEAYREENGTLTLVTPVNTGYRLPSEAEWEWAARFAGGQNGRRYPWGSGFPPPPRSGNFADPSAAGFAPQVIEGYEDGYAAASPVGSYAANALGLFDLGGNVAEWVHDAYDGTIAVDPPEVSDPFGPAGGTDHVVRGSSWMHARLVELRLAYREPAREARADVGFRVARYAE